jgi:ubiquinone/menaquinone biosynthesis C-methylase UbiE
MNDFDRIAPIYDSFKRVMFGDQLDRIVEGAVECIPSSSSVLIIGGGTGEILNYLPENCEVDYIEKSGKMIQRAKTQKREGVNFIHQDFLCVKTEKQYSFVICPFFLDLFNQNNLEKTIEQIMILLKPDGKLIVIDFEGENRWHHLLITLMYLFFRVTTNIETGQLLNINAVILSKGLRMIHEEARIKGLIYSRTYHINNFVK